MLDDNMEELVSKKNLASVIHNFAAKQLHFLAHSLTIKVLLSYLFLIAHKNHTVTFWQFAHVGQKLEIAGLSFLQMQYTICNNF